MALVTEAGTFALNTGTGNQTVTLANGSLTPKAVIVWTTRQTADGFTTEAKFFIGFGTSSTKRANVGSVAQDGQAASNTWRTHWNSELLTTYSTAGAVEESFDLVSFGAGEFVINVTDAGTAIKVHYLVLGGDDITSATIHEFSTSTGTQNITGVGFQPDFIMLLHAFDGTPDRALASTVCGVGFGTAGDQAAFGWGSGDNAATMNTHRAQRTDSIFAVPQEGADAYYVLASLSSLDADGFTLSYTTSIASGRKAWALCLAGGQYEVGSDTQKTSTAGTKATTTAFQPTGLLLASFCTTSGTSVVPHNRLSFGAASGATARAASWQGDTDNVADSECDRAMEQDQCLILADAGSPAGYAAAADLSSFNATDFTLDWDDGAGGNPDATAREFIWAAFGSEAVGGGDPEAGLVKGKLIRGGLLMRGALIG